MTTHTQFALDNPATLTFDLLTSVSTLAERLPRTWRRLFTPFVSKFKSADRHTEKVIDETNLPTYTTAIANVGRLYEIATDKCQD